jgi:hypothetical protein
MHNLTDYYHYDDITMMYIDVSDCKFLAHAHGCFVPGIRLVQTIAKRTLSRGTAVKKPVELMKALSELRRMQSVARAER